MGTALAAGATVREAAQLANYAAGVEVGKPGVATVSPEEVLAVYEEKFDRIGKAAAGRTDLTSVKEGESVNGERA